MRAVKIIFNLFLGIIGVCALLILAGHFGYLNTVKPFIVQSGSMAPSIPLGGVVLVRPDSSYNASDVITFRQEGSARKIVTHRIVAKEPLESGEFIYRTRGDANEESEIDKWIVRQADIVGKVYVTIPYLGFVIDLAKTPKGFILLVIIPATIIVYEEFRFLRRELARLFRRRRHSGGRHDISSTETVIVERGVPKAVLIVPLIGGLLVFTALSKAFFADLEQSTSNIISASTSFGPTGTPIPTPTPITNHLVINEVYYDPDAAHVEVGSDERDFEWIEIYNPTGSTVNLKNWKIMDNFGPERSISENDRDLASGEFAVLGKTDSVRNLWSIASEKFIAIGQRFGNGLANSDDVVILKDDTGNTVDQMSYGGDTTAFDPSAPDVVEGHSLERDPDGVDSDSAVDFVDRDAPTPAT